MTSRGKRKPRYGFDDIVMPRRLPRTVTRRQADNAFNHYAKQLQSSQEILPLQHEQVFSHTQDKFPHYCPQTRVRRVLPKPQRLDRRKHDQTLF